MPTACCVPHDCRRCCTAFCATWTVDLFPETLDRRVFRHFVYYVSQTQSVLEKIETVLDGSHPVWEPDPQHPSDLLGELREITLTQLKTRHPAPIGLFSLAPDRLAGNLQIARNDIAAMEAPIAAPAKTSLG